MQIGKMNFGQLATPIFGSRSDQTGAQSGDVPLAAPTDSTTGSSATSTSDYRQILSKYNVSDITPREFSQLIHDLSASGAINDSELQELTSIRFDLDKSGYDADEKVDLVNLFGARLKQLQESSKDAGTGVETSDQTPERRQANLDASQKQLEWLQKFATLHAESSSESLNTLV